MEFNCLRILSFFKSKTLDHDDLSKIIDEESKSRLYTATTMRVQYQSQNIEEIKERGEIKVVMNRSLSSYLNYLIK